MEKIKLGIIGTGNMGRNHVRLAIEHDNAKEIEFSGIYDIDLEKIKSMGLENIACNSPEELFSKVDAVIVAVPSSHHKEIGLLAAKHNVHLLMEKPIALQYEDGKELVRAYEKNTKVLMVGHVERYNPVVTELEKILSEEKLISVEINRCSPMDRRISDTDVIYDLMIHDVDILVNSINNKSQIMKMGAVGTTSYNETLKDYVQALFHFEDGVVASIISSRVTESKVRTIKLHCENAYVEADLLHRTITLARKTKYSLDIGYNPTYKQENVKEEIFVPNIESLKAEQLHFFDCIKNNKKPKTDGNSALKSMKILDEIKKAVY